MKKLLILAFISTCSLVAAKTYYVAPTGGSDLNPGSIDRPWATWQKAFNTAQAGDTVYFRDGVWYPTDVTWDNNITGIHPKIGRGHNGEPSNPICFFAYPGETPILDCKYVHAPPPNPFGDGNRYLCAISLHDAHWINWKGLTIRNVYQRVENVRAQGINGMVSNMTFERMTVHDIGGEGYYMFSVVNLHEDFGWDGSGYVPYDTTRYINCDTYQCCDTLPASIGNHPGNMGDGFKYLHEPEGYITFEGCRAWHCSDDGFDNAMLYTSNCWSFDHDYTDAGYDFEGNGFKPICASTNTVVFKNNLIAFCSGHGIQPVVSEGFTGKIRFYNNTIYKVGVGLVYTVDVPGIIYDFVYRNNIIYDPLQIDAGGRPYIHAYNNYYVESNNTWIYAEAGSLPNWDYHPTITVTDNDFLLVDKEEAIAQLTAPRKPDGSLPDITFLKLKAGSQLVDSGTQIPESDASGIVLSYNGSAPDLGYAEYNSGNVLPAEPKFLEALIGYNTPDRLEMTYSLPLANIIPAASAFAVRVNSTARAVSSVVISGTKVTLTLGSPVTYGDIVTVAYTKPATNPLQTAAGGQAASLTAQSVNNNYSSVINLPPTVQISSPTKSTSFTAPASITIDAVASDPDGSVIKIEFFNGNIKIGECISMPYFFVWKEVPAGTYILTAVATDNLNSKTTSDPVYVMVEKSASVVNQKPSINILKPRSDKGMKFKKNEKIVIEAEASDPDGEIIKVEFRNGNITIAELFEAPYIYIMENADTGKYIITAIAFDNLGASSESSEAEFLVFDPDDLDRIPIRIYPNPNHGVFTIDLSHLEPGMNPDRIYILNMSGNTIANDQLFEQEESKEFILSEAIPGIYIIMMTRDKHIISTGKFIIE